MASRQAFTNDILVVGCVVPNMDGIFIPLDIIKANPEYFRQRDESHFSMVPRKLAPIHPGDDIQIRDLANLGNDVPNPERVLSTENLEGASIQQCIDAVKRLTVYLQFKAAIDAETHAKVVYHCSKISELCKEKKILGREIAEP